MCVLREKVFTESLPNNGYTYHSTFHRETMSTYVHVHAMVEIWHITGSCVNMNFAVREYMVREGL
jgi:hypothetical protein